MKKGFIRHLFGFLGEALILLSLPGAPISHRPSSGPGWWEIRLIVAAKGEYAIRGGGTPISGEYACRASWEGRLEPDGDDFLLVHLKTEVLEWRLQEKSGPAGHESVLEAPAAPKPALRLIYVLKDGRDVEFVFELGGIPIPLHASPLAVALELPHSSGRQPGPPGQGYGDFVCRGSSRVVIPETDLLQQTPGRIFSWDWRREKRFVKEGRVFVVAQSHAAEAAVALTVH
jgi:hypothetical protein